MTHKITGILPAQSQHNRVEKSIKKRLKKPHLTHQMTHGYGIVSVAEMSVLTGITKGLENKYFTRFSSLSPTSKNVCQKKAHTLTPIAGMAYSLRLDLLIIKTQAL